MYRILRVCDTEISNGWSMSDERVVKTNGREY
jgi:hypothetical protein